MIAPAYDEADVEALQEEVLPKYLSFFNTLAVDRLVSSPQAAVMTCGPLCSSVVDAVVERLPNAHIRAFEPSTAGVKLAVERTSASASLPRHLRCEYETLTALPLGHPDATFTHAVLVHPIASATSRMSLLREASRVLVPAGQLLVAVPLRGSYPEIADMLREFSLKHDIPTFGEAIEIGAQSRPTPETLTDDLERLGLVDIAVDVELLSVAFESGREFASHPLFRLLVAPDLTSTIDAPPSILEQAVEYARTAVSRYWSEGPFDLTVNLGCASARKPDRAG